ncbi:MAG: single-stranded-DNA-specific exonuclease RecJ [Candidatus Magasanikbacteria bacterium]|nr:single-stranded-DNA-specific exonuclease RecJ [Candidatus Magasanikbacteria bacterium]
MKKWIVAEPPPKEFSDAHPELPTIVTRLLWNRGLKTQEQIDEFLNPDYEGDIHDPYLFNDMEKAVALIWDCIENDKKIVVHGDYDADGVCASAIILTTLKKLGAKKTGIFLPHRETDGYGLNNRTVQLLKDDGAELIITCDCGISNTEEITLAKSLGVRVIVTDHHAMPAVFPPADAIIHPLVPGEKYPDKTLAGGGVAFKLVQALLKRHRELTCHPEQSEGSLKPNERDSSATPQNDKGATQCKLPNGESYASAEKWLLDLVSISTVGDMVPLVGESRTLVRYGLTVLNKTRNIGLKKLLIVAGLIDENGKPKRTFDTTTIGFQIAPRINAAGRMDHANVAFALLMAETEEEATALATQLNKNNTDRQKLTDQIMAEARKQIQETGQENNSVIFTFGENWATGIVGLIASRIKEEFGKPAIAMGFNNGLITGSGRSVSGFNMIETLKTMPEFFYKFGGHPQACGFSLKSKDVLENFKKAMLTKAETGTVGLDLSPQIKIDAEVDLDEVNWKLYDLLQKFEPFGVANEEPLYAATNLTVMGVEPVGQDGKHLRLMVKHNSHVVRKTIAFGFGNVLRHPDNWSALRPGDKIDLAFTVGVNEWNGNRELQLQVEDIKKT